MSTYPSKQRLHPSVVLFHAYTLELPIRSHSSVAHETLPIRTVALALAQRRAVSKSQPETRHQPYRFRQPGHHKEGRNHGERKPSPVLAVDSLPPVVKSKLQGGNEKQWLLVGPDVARHLQMGGSVLVRDYVGNVVGWMS